MAEKLNKTEKVADSLLAEIREVSDIVDSVRARQAEAVRQAAEAYAGELSRWTEELNGLKDELVKLMKIHKDELFPAQPLPGTTGEAINMLPNGTLRMACRMAVKNVRNMLDTIKSLGRRDLIHVAETPDWDKIEHLADDELSTLGTQRKAYYRYEYDINKEEN